MKLKLKEFKKIFQIIKIVRWYPFNKKSKEIENFPITRYKRFISLKVEDIKGS